MSSDGSPPVSSWVSWAQLVRLPNVFTVIADVSAAFLLLAHGPDPLPRLLCVLAAAIALYWAGMILNDVFDLQRDRIERPDRPLPANLISVPTARAAGWALLLGGAALGGLCGFIPADGTPTTWFPAAVACTLAVMIVAYDGPLKATPIAPAAMGSCRALSFTLGASPHIASEGGITVPTYVIGIAAGFGIYIAGITTMARQEATGGHRGLLIGGLMIAVVGLAVLALAPGLENDPQGWHVAVFPTFAALIGVIGLPVAARGIAAIARPVPSTIQNAIRVGIATLIPLAACFALLGAGPFWGLAVFALMVPANVLAVRLRVT